MSITSYAPIISPFRIDVLNASGDVLGDGPLTNISRVDTTESLDKVGACTFEMPAADPRSAYIEAGCKFDIYVADDGVRMRYLGRYSYKSKRLVDNHGVSSLSVSCYDALRELSEITVGFRRTYVNEDVASVVSDLVGVAAGWTASSDVGIGNTTISFEGESPFAAVDALRDRWGQHFRLFSVDAGSTVLEFGAFGEDSGVRIANISGQVQGEIDNHNDIAIIDSMELLDEADDIYNSIIPLGSGTGVTQLTIESATLGSYAVSEGTNDDGSSYWYIQDAASVADYGTKWRVVTFPQIRPITNSAANIVNAANALKLTAEAYIAKHLVPRVTYGVNLRGLRCDLKVGDTVRLSYRGIVDGYSYINVEDDFYVMDISRSRSATGDRSARLTISTISERRTSDTDIVLDVVRDVNALKVHIAPTLAYSPVGPQTRRMDASNDALITVRISDEVQLLNYAILRFKSMPLRSSAKSAESSGAHRHMMFQAYTTASTPSQWGAYFYYDPDGNFSAFPLPWLISPPPGGRDLYTYQEAAGHTHTLDYGLYEDTQYPTSISVEIDGDDVTAALGGPWDAGGTGADEEVDITQYLIDAGLQQNHEIVFSCASGRGEIEVEVDMLVTIQPIAI